MAINKVYDSSLHSGDSERYEQDFQLAKQKERARSDPRGSGKALYNDEALQTRITNKQAKKDATLRNMGSRKAAIDTSVRVAKRGLDLRSDKMQYGLGQAKIGTFMAAGSMAIQAATSWRKYKLDQKRERQFDIQYGIYEKELAKGKKPIPPSLDALDI